MLRNICPRMGPYSITGFMSRHPATLLAMLLLHMEETYHDGVHVPFFFCCELQSFQFGGYPSPVYEG
ncbi:2-oxoglutarate-Fe(II) type oxidoreductase hxnY [Fusarium oxysporum f. sp. albedinis]|nr:2-oxoglutarate-Fe(II) type oxidoreductase hxnY [Fusarium oxysporum f. sp. albedinis]